MQKTKRPLSFLLAVLMIVGMFSAVPFTASAATTYTSGEHSFSELQQGDYIYKGANFTDDGTSGYQIVLKGGTYGDGNDVADLDLAVDGKYGFSIYVNVWLNRIIFDDIYNSYYPMVNGTIANAFLVQSVSGKTITLAGANISVGYTVTWKNMDGTVLETDKDVEEGVTPTYNGASPTLADDNIYTYTFAGWSPSVAAVTGDVTYTATYTHAYKYLSGNVYNSGNITIDNLEVGDLITTGINMATSTHYTVILRGGTYCYASSGTYGEVLNNDKVGEGIGHFTIQSVGTAILFSFTNEAINYYPSEYGHTTDTLVVMAKDNGTITLAGASIPTYTVTWKNEDGTTLETDANVPYGTTPTYDGATPERAEDAQYTYSFAGWNDDGTTTYAADALPAVTGDVTYTATFDATAKAAELPDAIKDCTYQYSYEDTIFAYANVPFAVGGYDQLLTGAISFEGDGTWISLYDAKEYSYTFYTEAGTEIPAESLYSGSGPSESFDTSDDFTVYINAYNLSGFTIGTDVLYIVAEEPAAATPNDQQFVTIDDQISITLALDLGTRGVRTDDVTINREVESVQAADTEGVYNYKIVMAPAQIADEIVVTIGSGNDAEEITTSIKGYCNELRGDAYNEYADAQALACAILAYGQAASNRFNGTTDEIPFLTANDVTAAQNAAAVFSDGTGKVSGASFMALTKPEFRFYTSGITESQGYDYNQAGITVTMDSVKPDQNLTARFVKKADGKVLIEVTGVTAENMDKTITVTVTGLGTITFNGNAFAKAMAKTKSGDTKQQNLGAALYNYGAAAKACFGA